MSELKGKIKKFLEHSSVSEISEDTQITVFKNESGMLGAAGMGSVVTNEGDNCKCVNRSVACGKGSNGGCSNYGSGCVGGSNTKCQNLPEMNYC